MVGRITMRKRLAAKLKKVKEELKERMHHPIVEQGGWLASVVRGYYQYHAIPGNYDAIVAFREHVARLWYRTLQRRSQRSCITRERMRELVNAWLPKAHVLHPWPEERMAAIIRDRSRMR